MANERFTPGPWRIVGGVKGNNLFVRIAAKDFSADANGRELHIIGAEDTHPIKEHMERRMADMRLIAAAPAMYEALRKMLSEMTNYDELVKTNTRDEEEYYKEWENAINEGEAALAAANPETPKP